jgi:hypothetical protein
MGNQFKERFPVNPIKQKQAALCIRATSAPRLNAQEIELKEIAAAKPEGECLSNVAPKSPDFAVSQSVSMNYIKSMHFAGDHCSKPAEITPSFILAGALDSALEQCAHTIIPGFLA